MNKIRNLLFALIAILVCAFEGKAEVYYFDSYFICGNNPQRVNEKAQVIVLDHQGVSKESLVDMDFALWDSKIKKYRTIDVIITKKNKLESGRYRYDGYVKKDKRAQASVVIDTSTKGKITFTLSIPGLIVELHGSVKKSNWAK